MPGCTCGPTMPLLRTSRWIHPSSSVSSASAEIPGSGQQALSAGRICAQQERPLGSDGGGGAEQFPVLAQQEVVGHARNVVRDHAVERLALGLLHTKNLHNLGELEGETGKSSEKPPRPPPNLDDGGGSRTADRS